MPVAPASALAPTRPGRQRTTTGSGGASVCARVSVQLYCHCACAPCSAAAGLAGARELLHEHFWLTAKQLWHGITTQQQRWSVRQRRTQSVSRHSLNTGRHILVTSAALSESMLLPVLSHGCNAEWSLWTKLHHLKDTLQCTRLWPGRQCALTGCVT